MSRGCCQDFVLGEGWGEGSVGFHLLWSQRGRDRHQQGQPGRESPGPGGEDIAGAGKASEAELSTEELSRTPRETEGPPRAAGRCGLRRELPSARA